MVILFIFIDALTSSLTLVDEFLDDFPVANSINFSNLFSCVVGCGGGMFGLGRVLSPEKIQGMGH
jgi:hypothetical protein